MVATQWFIVTFRIVHIVAGVLWVGSVFLLAVYVQPAAAAIAPAGAPFMAELLGRRRVVDGMLTLASITVIGGLVLYWHDWHLYASFGDWAGSRFGATLTIGMVAAIAAMGVGASVTRPGVRRMMALGREVAATGAPPSPEVAARMAALQARLKAAARVSLGLLLIATVTMAIARYV